MSDALKGRLLEVVRENADLILVPDPELRTYVPEARILQRAVELERLPFTGARRRSRPRICHAPTRRGAKGTQAIIDALDGLKQESLEFDFVLLEGLPHDALMKELAEADIVVDQIVIGWYGVLAVEAMALGKAVVAFIRDDLVHEVPQGVLVNASPKTIAARLRELVADADLRADLGRVARRYVETYHASGVVAAKLEGMYRELGQAPAREASIRLFASNIDSAFRLMGYTRRPADAKTGTAAAEKIEPAVGAQPASAPSAPAPTAKPAAPAKIKARPRRTLWQRIANLSLAKVVHRVKRIAGSD
jgi:hypothetical protein